MKKIYSIFLIAIASLFLAPAINAQHTINDYIKSKHGTTAASISFPKDKGVQIDKVNNVAYSKNVSSPYSDGTYYIKLETFATGSVVQTLSSTPSDIILILDSSTSMTTNDYGATITYSTSGVRNYSSQNITSQTFPHYYYYLEEDDAYYPVKGITSGGRCLTFTTKKGVVYYLNNYVSGGQGRETFSDDEGLSTTRPSQPQSNNIACWRGQLYTQVVSGGTSRIDALKEATEEFIDSIWENDQSIKSQIPSFEGHRIAIITYDQYARTLTNNYQWVQSGNASWFYIGAEGVRNRLKTAVGNIQTHAWTQPNTALSEAVDDLLDGTPAAKRPDANLTVLMFTDGVPCQGTVNTFEPWVANQALYYGHLLKGSYEAKLFSVGLLDLTSADENVIKGIHFLDLLSSNYPDSSMSGPDTNNSAWTINSDESVSVANISKGSVQDKDPDGDYFKLVDGDLTSIFSEISQQASGTTNESLSAATSNVDIVSNSFILPDGADTEVAIFTAPLSDIEYEEDDETIKKYVFGTETLAPYSTETYRELDDHGEETGDPIDIDGTEENPTIIPTIVGNKITVNGFDYSSNFCGPVKNSSGQNVDVRGYEIIILIPIKMNPEAVGGPNVATNVTGSGLYIDSDPSDPDAEPDISFESPTVSLPVNMYIEKKGLTGTESVKFRIERHVLPEDYDDWTDEERESFDPSALTTGWEYVSSVFVTNSSNSKTNPDTGEPWVKVKGMPATKSVNGKQRGLVYRISEEKWSWTYKDKLPEGESLQNGVYYQYTDTKHIENPFLFENETIDNRIDVKIRHAESKVTNHFSKTVQKTEVYDDSKPNTRTSDTN